MGCLLGMIFVVLLRLFLKTLLCVSIPLIMINSQVLQILQQFIKCLFSNYVLCLRPVYPARVRSTVYLFLLINVRDFQVSIGIILFRIILVFFQGVKKYRNRKVTLKVGN